MSSEPAVSEILDRVAATVASLAPAEGEGRPGRDRLVWINQHVVTGALACPRSVADPGTYVESAANLRRRVGTYALVETAEAEQSGRPIDNLRAARRVVQAADDLLGSNVAGWIEGLAPGGRTAVVVEAATWMGSVLDTLARSVDEDTSWNWQRPQVWREWTPPGSVVLIRARADALSTNNLRSPALSALIVLDRSADPQRDRIEAGFLAVVSAAVSGLAPRSVALCRVRERRIEPVPVDDELLEAAAAAIIAGVEAKVAGLGASAVPGRHCRWCAVRPVCPDAAPG